MKKALSILALVVLTAGAFLFSSPVNAQSTASHVVPGSESSTGTNCTIGPCWTPNSATNPVYVSPATGAPATSVTTTPGQRTIVPLDISTVTTGGTAVSALIAGHRTAGGFLYNPIGATINLCINEQGTASGTTSAGALTCVQPGQSYTLTPAAAAVSVVTSDSSHPFSGYGLN